MEASLQQLNAEHREILVSAGEVIFWRYLLIVQ